MSAPRGYFGGEFVACGAGELVVKSGELVTGGAVLVASTGGVTERLVAGGSTAGFAAGADGGGRGAAAGGFDSSFWNLVVGLVW